MTPFNHNDIKDKLAELLSQNGAMEIERLPVSGNNRLYMVTTEKNVFVVKHYFRHAEDERNRLDAEYSFISYAYNNNIKNIPAPIACDDKGGIGVYSFIKGRKPMHSDIDANAVESALRFLVDLNKRRFNSSEDFPVIASEACFSINSHISVIDARINRLRAITNANAVQFVQGELIPVWEKIKKDICFEAKAKGINTAEEITEEDRIISPSDFGFHNAIIGENGEFYFIDFEYAGWDDPAKTAGDFFSQVALPIPIEYVEHFISTVAALCFDKNKVMERSYLLLRLYKIKWCCIVLNHFLRMDSERRRFAGNIIEEMEEKQLDKAKKIIESIDEFNRRI